MPLIWKSAGNNPFTFKKGQSCNKIEQSMKNKQLGDAIKTYLSNTFMKFRYLRPLTCSSSIWAIAKWILPQPEKSYIASFAAKLVTVNISTSVISKTPFSRQSRLTAAFPFLFCIVHKTFVWDLRQQFFGSATHFFTSNNHNPKQCYRLSV